MLWEAPGEVGAYRLFLQCLDPAMRAGFPECCAVPLPSGSSSRDNWAQGGGMAIPVALCLPPFRQALAFPGSLASPWAQGPPHHLPSWLQELCVT